MRILDTNSIKKTLMLLIFASISFSTLVASLVISSNFYLDYKKSIIKNIEKVADKTKSDIEKALSLGLSLNDLPNVEMELVNALKVDPNTAYLFISDQNGYVKFSTVEAIKQKQITVKYGQKVEIGEGKSINVMIEINDPQQRPVYAINIGLKDSVLQKKILYTFLLFLMISALTIAICFIVVKKIIEVRLLDPLASLTEGTERVRAGDLSVSIDVKTHDEVGVVAANFSTMVQGIKEIVLSLKEGIGRLSQVSEFTGDLSQHVQQGSDIQRVKSSQIFEIFKSIESRVSMLKNKVNSLNDFVTTTSATFLEISSASDEIARIIDELVKSVERIESTYKNINNINHRLDQGADALSREVENILSFVSELDSTLKETSRNISETFEISEKMSSLATQSKNSLRKNIEIVKSMSLVANESRDSFSVLKKNIDKINNILSAIEEITEQTNMLALNAAIIAAQEERGRGAAFSVVATEIKELSKRTQSSTKEISEIIENIIGQTDEFYQKLLDNAQQSEQANTITQDVEAQITEIMSLVEKVNAGIRLNLKSVHEQTEAGSVLRKEVETLKSLSADLIVLKDEGAKGSKALGDILTFIGDVASKVTNSVREQNLSMGGIKRSLTELSDFSKDLLDHIEKEVTELGSTKPILNEIDKLATDNNTSSKELQNKLIELKDLIKKFRDLTQKFSLEK